MNVRAKEHPRRVIHVDLEAGSLFVMDYTTRIRYTYASPKNTAHVGERISLTFRVKHPRKAPPGSPGGDRY